MNNLQFNKFSVLALALAVILGLIIGNVFTSTIKGKQLKSLQNKYEQLINDQVKYSQEQIKYRDDSIKVLLEKGKKDSLEVVKLKTDIVSNSTRVEHKREEAKKLTKNEKADWLISRYTIDSLLSHN